jgi:predicted ester cyclase
MAAAAKKIVQKFLDSDVFVNVEEFDYYIHKDLKMHWHASSGYREFNYDDYYRLCQSTAASYESMRSEVTHMISDKKEVAARFTVYVRTNENPREEIPVGYFISIFKLEDDKIIEVHQSSHPSQD